MQYIDALQRAQVEINNSQREPNKISEYNNQLDVDVSSESRAFKTTIAYDAMYNSQLPPNSNFVYNDPPYIDTLQSAQVENNYNSQREPNNISEYNNQLYVDASSESRGFKTTITSSQTPPKSIYTYIDQFDVDSLNNSSFVQNHGAYNDLTATDGLGYIHDVDFRATGSLP